MSRNEQTYDALVGYDENGNAVVLNYTFSYGEGEYFDKPFHGATGMILELISQERYDSDTEIENLTEYAEEIWRMAVHEGNVTEGLTDWVENNQDEIIEMLYDSGARCDIPGDHVTTNCIAVGRIFPREIDNLVTIVRPDLVEVIREAEKGNPE